jgi:hypothetical protein
MKKRAEMLPIREKHNQLLAEQADFRKKNSNKVYLKVKSQHDEVVE